MKTFFGALALAFAVPAAAQSAPAVGPHAGHSQHQQQAAPGSAHGQMNDARMMEMCKDPKASAEMKAHCAEMMKQHGQHKPAQQPQTQHAH